MSANFLATLNTPSIKRVLQEQLLKAIQGSNRETITNRDPSLELAAEAIPLYRLKDKDSIGIVYRCAIAFSLASVNNLSRVAIAIELVNVLTNSLSASDSEDDPLLDFTVKAVEPGWIDFYLSDRALAVWLQNLPLLLGDGGAGERGSRGEGEQGRGGDQKDLNVFPIQYACARCCSLLRLGHRSGLIKLNNLDLNCSLWQWLEPLPIPWFNSHLQQRHFQLVHPAEKHLIAQLLNLADIPLDSQKVDWVKQGMLLSQAMLDFDRSCRIWGEVSSQTPDLAKARLGLISVTQFVLQWLLKEQLGVIAPQEL
ncbi:MAG: hypothetical protein QNJ54_18860 [Prochloraceae cyanobacterium]|nr:hypothetical protein [Prochloraceae cyanobacterium]